MFLVMLATGAGAATLHLELQPEGCERFSFDVPDVSSGTITVMWSIHDDEP